MTTKRILERVDGASTKFHELWIDGTTLMARSGTSAGGAHLSATDAGTADGAAQAMDDKVRRALAKGYAELAAPAPATSVAQVGPELLAAKLAELPPLVDDPAYLVFADWLQSHGDPWGELVSLHYATAKATAKERASLAKAADALLVERGPALLGPAATRPYSRFDWHHGFVRAATIETTTDPESIVTAITTLLAQPVAHMMDGVVIHAIPAHFTTHRDWDSSVENVVDPWTAETLASIATALPERISHVGFGGWPAPAASAYLRMPSYTALTTAFGARLRRLELTGWSADEPGTLDMPELVELEVRFGRCNGEGDLGAITSSNLPKLERITVWIGGWAYCILDDLYGSEDGDSEYPDSYHGSDLDQLSVNDVSANLSTSELAAFIDALPATITHLGVRSARLDAEMCEAILARPLLATLVSLDLSGGMLDDDTAKLLLTPAAKATLGHLASLDLSKNRLGAATAKKLAAAYPNARVGEQRKVAQPELFVRYVAVME